jgi:hypothetical protein
MMMVIMNEILDPLHYTVKYLILVKEKKIPTTEILFRFNNLTTTDKNKVN